MRIFGHDISKNLRLALFVKDDVVAICLFPDMFWSWHPSVDSHGSGQMITTSADITPNIVKTLRSPGVHDTPTTGFEQSDVRESPPKNALKIQVGGNYRKFCPGGSPSVDRLVGFELTHPNVVAFNMSSLLDWTGLVGWRS